ncbi:MAG: Chromosome partition protein Smc [Phycisphaerae bacterium]|nr:Chromosome partition protein Smc [Phycisphaerae bacterium]
MVNGTATQRCAFLGALLLGHSTALAQEQPDSRPAREPAPAQAEPRKPGESDATPTDAEKIARLQRAIDDSTRQVEKLRAQLSDPASEFAQAESAFAKLDQQLQEARKALAASGDGDDGRARQRQSELNDLQPKHKLAKDRFDLAIRERKTLQEQIATLQQKILQDTDALKKLKGEHGPPTTQPAAETHAVPTQTPIVPAPASGPPLTDAPTPPAAPAAVDAPAPAVNAAPVSQNPAPTSAAPDVTEARQEADRKQAQAQVAQEEVASITDRMSALRKSIELEQKQFENSRRKAENAQATERTLYESLQKKWETGAAPSERSELRGQINQARERLREAQAEIRNRTDQLDQYQAELSALQTEHIAAMEEAQRRQSDAAQAQKRVEHLESPLSPRNLWRWFLQRGPKVGGIIAAMFGLLWLSRLVEGRVVQLMAGRGGQGSTEDRENRARTLVGVIHSAATIGIYAGGGLMILTEVGVNIVPLMGGAAVLGLAVAFGAQNLIRDYFYGFMILLENQYTINDVVKIGDVAGQVERITLRVTVLRGLDGTVHFVPNGEITRVSNMTHEWSRALFEIPVAYKVDVDRVMHELMELAKELRRDPEFRGLILEMPEMLGVDEFADSAVVIKFLIKTRPLKQWTVKRELLRRIKRRFDELGIEIPFPQRTIHHRYEDGGEEPPSSHSGRFEHEPRR